MIEYLGRGFHLSLTWQGGRSNINILYRLWGNQKDFLLEISFRSDYYFLCLYHLYIFDSSWVVDRYTYRLLVNVKFEMVDYQRLKYDDTTRKNLCMNC